MNETDNQEQIRRAQGRPSKHGLTALRKAVQARNGGLLDRRYKLGKALHSWKEDLVADLGGIDSVSTQKRAIVDMAIKAKLILDSVDAWLLQQPSLINKRTRSLIPAVQQRQTLADGLARNLKDLGLDRKAREINITTTLAEIKREEEGKT